MILRRCLAGACLLFVGVLALGSTGSSPARGQGGGCAADQFGAVVYSNSTSDGAISGDGTKIAYIDENPIINGFGADLLMVANYDGTNPQVIASGEPGADWVSMDNPELNYDGSVVAVGWRPQGATNNQSFAVIDVANPTDIEVNHGFRPRLSNDGTKVAVLHIAAGHLPGITVYDLAAGTEVFIEEGPEQNFYNADLSGNGQYMVYGRLDHPGVSADSRVAVVDLATETEIDLIDDAGSFPLNISDDGGKVFFQSDFTGEHIVRSGGTDTVITSMGQPQTRFGTQHANFGYYNEVMSADGTKIVYTAELEDPYRTVFIEQIDIAADSVSASLYLEDPADGFIRHMETSADGSASILPAPQPLIAGANGDFYRWSACSGGMPPAPTPTATPLPDPETPTLVTIAYESGNGTDGIPKLHSTWNGVNLVYEVVWFRGLTEAEIVAGGSSLGVASELIFEFDEATLSLPPFAPAAGQNEWCVTLSGVVETNVSLASAPVCATSLTCDNNYVTVRMFVGDNPTTGNDVILGTTGADTIDALGGDDTVCAGAGDDVIFGGGGDDMILASGGDDTVQAGGGDDRIIGGSGEDLIDGGPGKDFLFGNGDDDALEGGTGVDRIRGGAGQDSISGGAAVDRLYGDDGDDTIVGGGGNDYMYGGTGDDDIDGKQGTNDRAIGEDGNDFCVAESQTTCENIRCGINHVKPGLGLIVNPQLFVFDCVHVTQNYNVYFNPQTTGDEDTDLEAIYAETATNLGTRLEIAFSLFTAGRWSIPEPLKEDDGQLPVYVRPAPPAEGFSPPNHIEFDSERIVRVTGPSRDLVAHEVFHQFQWQIEGITNQVSAIGPSTSWLEAHAEYAACERYSMLPDSGYCRHFKWRTKYFNGDPEEKPWNPGAKNYEGVNFYRWVEDLHTRNAVVDIVKMGSDHETGLLNLLGATSCGGQTCYHSLHDWRTLTSPNFDAVKTLPDRTIGRSADTGGAALLDLSRSAGAVAIVHEGLSPIDVTVISDTGPATSTNLETGVPCSVRATTTPAADAGVMFVSFGGCTNGRVVATNVGTAESHVIIMDVTDVLPTGSTLYNYPMPISIVGAFNMGTIRADVLCDALGLTGYHAEPGATTGEIASADNWDNYVSCWGGTINVQSLEAAVDVTEDDEDLCVRRDPVAVSAGGTHREFTFSTAPCV